MGHPLRTVRQMLWALLVICSLASAQEKETLRPEVARPLQAAQEAIRAGKGADALARVKEAEAVPYRSAYEIFITDRMKGSAAMLAGDVPRAMAGFEAAYASGRLAGPERLSVLQALAGLSLRSGQPMSTVTWARRYLESGGTDTAVRAALVQALVAVEEFDSAAKEVSVLIAADLAAGKVPDEAQLRLLGFCQLKTADDTGYTQTLERLVTHHPKPEYWADLLSRLSRRTGFADRLQLDALRLARRVGGLEDGSEYMDLAQLALQAGIPGEALSVVDEGFAKGLLGKGAQAERHLRLRSSAQKAAAEDRASLGASEESARKARDGALLMSTGLAAWSHGQTEKGLALMAEGIARGQARHPDDARLHYGMALLANGQRMAAESQFKAITATDGVADLARLWLLVR